MQNKNYWVKLLLLLLWMWWCCCAGPQEQVMTIEDLDVEANSEYLDAEEQQQRLKRLVISNKGVKPANKKRSKLDKTDEEHIYSEQEVIETVISGSNYNWRVRPRGLDQNNTDTGGPVMVYVNLYLRSISKIDDVNMEYSAQFTFREEWNDVRLAFKKYDVFKHIPFVILAPGQLIWMPDTFFQNEKEARKHDIDKPNVLIRIYPEGRILYSVRITLTLSCPMNLQNYPLDQQICYIDLASYAYTTQDIKYEWRANEPIQIKEGLNKSLPSFKLEDVTTAYCTSVTATGEYSCLRTMLILRREFSYYLLQLYIPSFMLVIVSWVSFWLDKDSVPARVTLGVTTLLTMTTQASGVNAKLPPVSYTKAIDVWIGCCLAFIFGALLEFALVNYAARKDIMRNVGAAARRAGTRKLPPAPPMHHSLTGPPEIEIVETGGGPIGNDQQQQQQQNYNTFQPNLPVSKQGYVTVLQHVLNNANSRANSLRPSNNKNNINKRKFHCFDLWLSKYKERSKRIDVIARVVFPIGFFCFNCIYWVCYLS